MLVFPKAIEMKKMSDIISLQRHTRAALENNLAAKFAHCFGGPEDLDRIATRMARQIVANKPHGTHRS